MRVCCCCCCCYMHYLNTTALCWPPAIYTVGDFRDTLSNEWTWVSLPLSILTLASSFHLDEKEKHHDTNMFMGWPNIDTNSEMRKWRRRAETEAEKHSGYYRHTYSFKITCQMPLLNFVWFITISQPTKSKPKLNERERISGCTFRRISSKTHKALRHLTHLRRL